MGHKWGVQGDYLLAMAVNASTQFKVISTVA